MPEKLKNRLTHALLTLMLTFGLLLPLLGILHTPFLSPAAVPPVLLTVLLFELSCINRKTAVAGAVLAGTCLLAWLFLLGGLTVVSDIVFASALRFSGIRTALPLVGGPAVLLFSVTVTLVCCFACLRSASGMPALLLCVGMGLLLYLTDSGSLVPWFLPALAALLLILMTDRFRETPILPVLPWAVLLVAAAFLLSGFNAENTPLKQKADELRQAVLDRLFFTEPRDVFSLSSEGFYPEGQDQLGGKPDPDNQPVMQVSTPRVVYLRGVIFNEYTGRNWRNTTGGRRYLWQSPRLTAQRAALFDENLPSGTVQNAQCEPVTVSVRMISDSASTLFVPQRVRSLLPGGELVPYFSDSSELFVTRNLQAGDTYSVSAPIFQAGDPGLGTLIEVCSTLEDDAYGRIYEKYTVLPSHLEEPVWQLAREAASVAVSPYDQALAIQSWLSRSYRYTLDVDPQPSDMDFVTNFLLNTRQGYCTYFASAMTVLCRMAGLPARYVEGYVAEPDKNGTALVTGMNAHAWTEVYFKGFGWLTFDATPKTRGSDPSSGEPDPTPTPEPDPPQEDPTPEPDDTDDEPSSSPEPDEEPSPEPTPAPTDPPAEPEPSAAPNPDPSPLPDADHPPFPWLWLVLLLLALLAAARLVLTSPSVRARRAKNENARLEVWAQEIHDLLASENQTRHPDESPMAFCRRVDRTGRFSVALGPVGECVSLIRYSRAVPQETDTRLLQDTALLLKGELSRPARLRYLAGRFFLPLSRRSFAR